jgi:aspartyl-tRNA(Asn)/glutamyl-tRNA(Gln) amidotransferase subunit B
MRRKEEADDYRYFPDPDLPPLVLTASWVEALRRELPERPWERMARYVSALELEPELSRELALDPGLSVYLDRLLQAASVSPRTAAHWIRSELVASARARKVSLAAAPPPERLGEVLELLESRAVSGPAAKTLWNALWDDPRPARELAIQLGLIQERDPNLLEVWVQQVFEEHPRQLAELRSGKEKVLGFFVGRIVQRSGGKADPKAVRQRLERELGSSETPDPRPS